ncbi:MAG TPA: hypothetical protein VIG61_09025 [Fusobacterium sp.]|uniref:hypothetical protein n=1 Tax=Fusobacterium sp. TaxID=68766 RepID=UPI002F418E58
MKIELTKVYYFGGKEFSTLELELENMTGKDLLQCEREFKARNKEAGAIKELEDSWAITVAAKAADVKYGDLISMSLTDYLKVVNQVKLFLSKGWDSRSEKEEKNSTEEVTV